MAQINRYVFAIKETLGKQDINPEKGKRTTKKTTRYLLKLFESVDDPRVHGMVKYPLGYILLIAFLSVLGGSSTWEEMECFGTDMSRWLRKFIDVKKYGIPSHDTFRRVFGIIEPGCLQDVTVSVLSENMSLIRKSLHLDCGDDRGYRHICIDGKEENGTGRKYSKSAGGRVRNIQTLHVYDATNQICIASEAIDKKTNEIPVAQRILGAMDLKGTLCTFDALHMQKNTVKTILSKGGNYVGGLKGNQQALMEEAESFFSGEVLDKLRKSRKKKKPVYIKTIEHSHSQMETREFFLVELPQNDVRDEQWGQIRVFVLCLKTVVPDNPKKEPFTELRYYASDLDDLVVISDAIRAHWAVEQFHWQLDASFDEDGNRTMDANAYENLSLLNKMVLHLMQLMKANGEKSSVRTLRKRFSWNFENALELLLAMFNDEAIINTIQRQQESKMEQELC